MLTFANVRMKPGLFGVKVGWLVMMAQPLPASLSRTSTRNSRLERPQCLGSVSGKRRPMSPSAAAPRSASQIALFVAPVLVLVSYLLGPTPMDLQFWPGAVAMIFIATLTACFVTNSGRSAWFVGVLLLMVYLVFAMALYLLPPRAQ
jgi:hypothetical protein